MVVFIVFLSFDLDALKCYVIFIGVLCSARYPLLVLFMNAIYDFEPFSAQCIKVSFYISRNWFNLIFNMPEGFRAAAVIVVYPCI